MKSLMIPIVTVIALIMVIPTVNAQIQQPQYCTVCPQPQPQQTQLVPQQQYVQPQTQQPLLATIPQPPPLTIQNITQAITTALDPIQKHLAVQDAEIANITTIITKLQTAPAPLPQPLPPPPPTNNNSTSPPPPPPGQGSSCPNQNGPMGQSSCPFSQGGGGPSFGGPPINQYFYPGFGPGQGNFGGHGGHHGR